MRQPFYFLVLASVLVAGSIAPAAAQMLEPIGCDPRSGCTYPMETPPPTEAQPKPNRKQARFSVPIPRDAPLSLERVAAAPPFSARDKEPAPIPAFEAVVPVALALSLNFAPPPLAEPRVSPTTCLLERAFSDVHVADPDDTALKPRLFERGVKMLASRAGAAINGAFDQTH